MTKKKKKIGDETVVMGRVSNIDIGDRSVCVGATDNKGNTILNQPMAVGYKAYAGTNAIAIGAYAGAGCNLIDNLLNSIENLVSGADDRSLSDDFNLLKIEIKSGKKSNQEISSSLDNFLNKCKNAISASATAVTLIELICKLREIYQSIFSS